MAVGLCVPGTGFTRVLTSLFGRLQDTYDIHWLGIGYKGSIITTDGYTLYPTNLEGGDLYAAYQMGALVEALKADFIFLLNDFWMFKNYERVIKTLNHQPTTVAYIPLDGKVDNPKDVEDTLFLDHIVCYTQFSLTETVNAFSKIVEQEQHPECHVIPHGTDLDDFYPLAHRNLPGQFINRTRVKETVFPELLNSKESFIVLNANRISERKALHLTIEGFAKFASNKPNAYLCFHLPNTPELILNKFKVQIANSGISEKIILNPLGNDYVSSDTLNMLYNACDVGVNTSMGEGWGMIAFEHAATGAAQIVPNHTACQELWKDSAELLDVKEWKVLYNNPFTMGEINPMSLKDSLENLYKDKSALMKYSIKAYNLANSNIYDWDRISNSWDSLFSKSLDNSKVEQITS